MFVFVYALCIKLIVFRIKGDDFKQFKVHDGSYLLKSIEN